MKLEQPPQETDKNDVRGYIYTLFGFLSRKIILTLILMVFISFTEGLALFLLLPLLKLVGLPVEASSFAPLGNYLVGAFTALGLQTNLLTVLSIFVAVNIIISFFYRLQTISVVNIENEFTLKLRERLYSAISHSNWNFFSKMRSSDLAHALINETDRLGMGSYYLLILISSSMVAVVYIIFALQLSGLVTIFIFIMGAALLLLLKRKTHSSTLSGEDISLANKDLYYATVQQLDGMKTIKSYGIEDRAIFNQTTLNVADMNIKAVRNFADVKFYFDVGSVVMLSLVVLLLIQIIQVPVASLLVLVYIFFRIIPMFSNIQYQYQFFINILPSYANVQNLQKRFEEASEALIKEKRQINLSQEIRLEQVTFSYNHQPVLQDVNMTITAGKTTALVGPSGAGKSTIADLVLGLITPQKGRITVDGKTISGKDMLSWRDGVGYVAQEPFLFHDTIHANLLLAQKNATEDMITNALKMAAAHEFVEKLPEGLESVVGDRGVLLSGGERQRLALARALLRQPQLLILDEATSNLDSENEKRIMEAIEKLHGQITILIIAHRLSTIRNADKIYLLEQGSIIESGTWKELTSKPGPFHMLCKTQNIN